MTLPKIKTIKSIHRAQLQKELHSKVTNFLVEYGQEPQSTTLTNIFIPINLMHPVQVYLCSTSTKGNHLDTLVEWKQVKLAPLTLITLLVTVNAWRPPHLCKIKFSTLSKYQPSRQYYARNSVMLFFY